MTMISSRPLTERMLNAFLKLKLYDRLASGEFEALRLHLSGLLAARTFPAYRGRWIDIPAMADATGIDPDRLLTVRPALQPLCDAISRAVADGRTSRAPLIRPSSRPDAPAAADANPEPRP